MKGQTTGRPRRSKESDKQNGAKTDDDEQLMLNIL